VEAGSGRMTGTTTLFSERPGVAQVRAVCAYRRQVSLACSPLPFKKDSVRRNPSLTMISGVRGIEFEGARTEPRGKASWLRPRSCNMGVLQEFGMLHN
jgi:hypothetical protein